MGSSPTETTGLMRTTVCVDNEQSKVTPIQGCSVQDNVCSSVYSFCFLSWSLCLFIVIIIRWCASRDDLSYFSILHRAWCFYSDLFCSSAPWSSHPFIYLLISHLVFLLSFHLKCPQKLSFTVHVLICFMPFSHWLQS